LKGQLGHGSVGNDLNSIPFPAIEKIEILRDGASAQYGSDAIAGVINFQLRKSIGKTSIQVHLGQFYEGDGEKFSIGANRGIALNKKGFLNFSASYRYQEPTSRGGEYQGLVYDSVQSNYTVRQTDSVISLDSQKVLQRGFDRKAPARIGNLRQINAGLLVNGGYDFNNRSSAFWTVAFNNRELDQKPAYRLPKDSSSINLALYPDGFQPTVRSDISDATFIAGVKTETKLGGHWDFNSSYGINSSKSNATHTNNASQSYLGANAPTSFYLGYDKYKLLLNNLNFAKSYFNLPGQMKTLSLGWGLEWRLENYHTQEGDSASWYNYDPTSKKQGGGNPGPESAVNKSRNVYSTYAEFESDLSSRFLMNIAGRYEYYSDFGGSIAGKLAIRYKFSDGLSVRASISNGFRAPSLQQRYFTAITTTFNNSGTALIPIRKGTFPNDNPVVRSLDIPSLEPEKTINIGAGFTSSVSNHISMTVDAYWIEIKNRIVISGVFNSKIPAVKKVLDSLNVDQIQFFTNAINTTTRGIDIILNGKWNIHKSMLSIDLAGNFTSTRLFGAIKTSDKLPPDSLNTNTLFNEEERTKMEKGQPNSKIILSMAYQTGKIKWIVTNTRFGTTSIAPIYQKPLRIMYESFSAKILTDVSLSYFLKKWIALTLGANNVFNVYPDRLKKDNTSQGMWIYSPDASPFGFNGGYYYVAMSFDF
jgi:iron complex outermembrane receptor protein